MDSWRLRFKTHYFDFLNWEISNLFWALKLLEYKDEREDLSGDEEIITRETTKNVV